MAARPCGPVAARRMSTHVRANAIFTVRTRFLPRLRVNADARGCPDDVRGRPDEKDIRTDIFIQKRPL
jgi:hypothetical protein